MPGYLTDIEIADPHLIPQSIWENFPARQKILLTEREFSSQEWAPLDQRRFRLEPESYRTKLSFANLGALRLSRSAGSQAVRMTTRLPAVDGFGISMIERGTSGLVFPGTDEPAAANATIDPMQKSECKGSAKPRLRQTCGQKPEAMLTMPATRANLAA